MNLNQDIPVPTRMFDDMRVRIERKRVSPPEFSVIFANDVCAVESHHQPLDVLLLMMETAADAVRIALKEHGSMSQDVVVHKTPAHGK